MRVLILVCCLVLAGVSVGHAVGEPVAFKPGIARGGEHHIAVTDSTWLEPPNLNGAIISSEVIGQFDVETETANDFVFGEAGYVTHLRWWGGYFNYAPGNPHVQGFVIRVLADGGGEPAAILAEWILPDLCMETFVAQQGDSPLYSYDVDLEFPVDANVRYWLDIQADDHAYPPQWGRLEAQAVADNEGMFRSDYFGYPDWVPVSQLLGRPWDASVEVMMIPDRTEGILQCADGTPLANCQVQVDYYDGNNNHVDGGTTTTDGTGFWNLSVVGQGPFPGGYFIVSSPCCSHNWTVPRNAPKGNLGTLVCTSCGNHECPQTYFYQRTAGVADNFVSPQEPLSPDAVQTTQWQTCYPGGTRTGCDDPTPNRWRLHTFHFPPCEIVNARLTIRLKAICDIPDNDSFNLKITNPFTCTPPWAWASAIKNIPGVPNPGHWDCNDVATLSLDLSNLPGGTDILPLLADGRLDITIQDDTDVDYIQLDIESCCPDKPCPRAYYVQRLAGQKDGYAGSTEPTTQGAAFNNWLATCAPTHPPLRAFDEGGADKWFAHTFQICQGQVVDGQICFRARSTNALYTTDAIYIGLPGTCSSTWAWGRRLVDLPGGWNGTDKVFCLNLSALPLAAGGTTSILPSINGTIDVLVQDDTQIDYMELKADVCCRPYDPIVDVNVIGGAIDDFVLPIEPANPKGSLTDYIVGQTGMQPIGFDAVPGVNAPAGSWFANTLRFGGHPVRAQLVIRAKASPEASQAATNDDVLSCDWWLDPPNLMYETNLRDLPAAGGTWNPGQTATFVLDLGVLPLSDGGLMNLLEGLQSGELNVVVSDNTAVDAMVLYLETGLEPGDVPVEGATQTTAIVLDQNRPNPFSPQTLIQFSLPRESDAELSILDVTGRLVRRLATGSLAAGPHTLTWDGRNDRGDRVSSGIYFYRLRANGAEVSRKMLLTR